MINDLENDLNKIYIDIVKSKRKYYMVSFFYNQAKERVERAPEKELTIKAGETAAEIFTVFVDEIREEYIRICEGKIFLLSNKDLDELEAHFQEILVNIDILNEKFKKIVE